MKLTKATVFIIFGVFLTSDLPMKSGQPILLSFTERIHLFFETIQQSSRFFLSEICINLLLTKQHKTVIPGDISSNKANIVLSVGPFKYSNLYTNFNTQVIDSTSLMSDYECFTKVIILLTQSRILFLYSKYLFIPRILKRYFGVDLTDDKGNFKCVFKSIPICTYYDCIGYGLRCLQYLIWFKYVRLPGKSMRIPLLTVTMALECSVDFICDVASNIRISKNTHITDNELFFLYYRTKQFIKKIITGKPADMLSQADLRTVEWRKNSFYKESFRFLVDGLFT